MVTRSQNENNIIIRGDKMKLVICKVCNGTKKYITTTGKSRNCNYCNEDGMRIRIDVLSWGLGTQSSAMLDMAAEGEFEFMPDYVITADPQWEPKEVYEWRDKVIPYIEKKGLEVIEVSAGNIYDDTMRSLETGERVASMPLFMINPKLPQGHPNRKMMINRQCTMEYKIQPINRKIKSLLGYKPREIVKHQVHMWRGITTDEITRVKPAKDNWLVFEHPLIFEKDMDRLQAIERARKMGLGDPPSSSCIGCPFHRDDLWQSIKYKYPDEFESAVKLDRAIRHHPKFPGKELYLHRSCIPLEDVEFGGDLFNGFENECFGVCGV